MDIAREKKLMDTITREFYNNQSIDQRSLMCDLLDPMAYSTT